MGVPWAVGMLTLALLASTALYPIEGRVHSEEGLEMSEPQEVFHSDGGRLEMWSHKYLAMQEARVAAVRLTLEPRGLAMLQYSDAPELIYVLKGRGKIGLSYPWMKSPTIRSVKAGEVFAIPQGVPHWFYNDGNDKSVCFGVSDTSRRGETGQYRNFYLHGASQKDWGSVLHGFSEELLSQAWDVDRDIVKKIRESQKGTVIIKVQQDLDIRSGSGSKEQESEYWENFTFNMDESKPDLDVENGGTFTAVTRTKMPLLSEMHLSAIRVKLEMDAMFAPAYVTNAHVLMYVTKGSGRVQIVGTGGEQMLNTQVKEGSVVMIPRMHPTIKKAGKDGLEIISITTCDMPMMAFLAGKNSVYKNVPKEVLAASNNVDVKIEEEILAKRMHDAVIFPPRESNSGTEAVLTKLSDDLKELLERVHIQF